MNHPLASEVPSLEVLVKAHVQYMARLAETEQEESQALIQSLNMPELLEIAGRALGSECHRADKIYQGMSESLVFVESFTNLVLT
jgi:hypothetical protein